MAVYLICYVISFIMARLHVYVLSGLVLIVAAVYLYSRDYSKTHNLIHLRGLFCISFVGGQGISCLKLSTLGQDWSVLTWICMGLTVLVFWFVFEACTREFDSWSAADMGTVYRWYSSSDSPLEKRRIFISMVGLTILSWAAFIFEIVKLKFLPILSYGVPHAYSTFHVSGVHYFTVSCVLVPGLAVLYILSLSKRTRGLFSERTLWVAVACFFLSLLIPIALVSRFQLLFGLLLALFTYISVTGTIKGRYVIALVIFALPLYLLLSVLRSHSVEYLNGIFEMKNPNTPIFITQPYIYIANNYDNFNCLVTGLDQFALGKRMLFPVWAFTGIKFFFPSLANLPLYLTKEELTTLTIIYDAYYDFGVIGIVLFSAFLGWLCWALLRFKRRPGSIVGHLIYSQFALYMVMAFFTTWFSNPTTWFYLVLSLLVYGYIVC